MSEPATPGVEMTDGWWEQRAEAFGAWVEQIDPADLEPADTGALQAIARLTDLRKEVDTAILEAVREARQRRRTWAEIGAMLGVTRQAAQHKYAPALARTQSETSTQQEDESTASDPQERIGLPDPSPRQRRSRSERAGPASPSA